MLEKIVLKTSDLLLTVPMLYYGYGGRKVAKFRDTNLIHSSGKRQNNR